MVARLHPLPLNPARSMIPVARMADMLLHPGESYEYTSGASIPTPVGTMRFRSARPASIGRGSRT